ncbi:MAG: hypothetical protein KAR83_03995 [Thermodesulfovibrionales bacterium]|nr:hypothetical protein [Thermodesulfovibrionales bacterium]
MKNVGNALIMLAALLLLSALSAPAAPAALAGQPGQPERSGPSGPFRSNGIGMPKCTVCHSKDPKMKAMHKALDYKDCFTCHGRGKLWPKDQRQRQKTEDPLCTRCHMPSEPASDNSNTN